STTVRNAGDSLSLSISATGTPPLTFQWKKDSNNLSNGSMANRSIISGAISPSLTLTSIRATDAGVYICTAHNSAGDAISHSTTLIVNDPVITAQPASFTAECGGVWPCLSVSAL